MGNFVVCLLMLEKAASAFPSLFFSDNDINLITDSLLVKDDLDRESSEDLYLFGILFLDPKNWTIWLNNKIIRSDSLEQHRGFKIKKVSPQDVQFMVLSKDSLIEFTLRPHQIFLVKERRIISKE